MLSRSEIPSPVAPTDLNQGAKAPGCKAAKPTAPRFSTVDARDPPGSLLNDHGAGHPGVNRTVVRVRSHRRRHHHRATSGGKVYRGRYGAIGERDVVLDAVVVGELNRCSRRHLN